MGTNYYLETNVCPHCGRCNEKLHIGKSAAGWCFCLHVLNEPDHGRTAESLEDWKLLFSAPDSQIVDEYGGIVTPREMLDVICQRSGRKKRYSHEFLEENGAMAGPNNLLRQQPGTFCVCHGSGTWDLCVGEYS